MPSAASIRAATWLNKQTDRLLRQIGVNPGPMTEANHLTTAEIIDREARIPELVAALEAALPELENYINYCANYEAPEGLEQLRKTTDLVRAAVFTAKGCKHDTNKDGDCHLCARSGGCLMKGGA